MFQTYIRSIFDELPPEVATRAILAGGALRAYYDHTEVKDYDLFFRSKGQYDEAVIALFATEGWESVQVPGASGVVNFRAPSGKIFNLVGFHFGSAKETIERFDLRCCCISAELAFDTVWVRSVPGAVEDATERRLTLLNNNGTDRTVRRIEHYVDDYGYTIELPDDPGPEAPEEAPYRPQEDTSGIRARRIRKLTTRVPRGHGGYP